MASTLAQPDAPKVDDVHMSSPADAPLSNGDHKSEMVVDIDTRIPHKDPENVLSAKPEPVLKTSDAPAATEDVAGPTPVEDVAPGQEPVTGFMPKDAPASHPTPPPDEPLNTSDARVDTNMSDAPPTNGPTPAASSADSSVLVRPREDDAEDDEVPASKRSKVADDSNGESRDLVPATSSAPSQPESVPVDTSQASSTLAGNHTEPTKPVELAAAPETSPATTNGTSAAHADAAASVPNVKAEGTAVKSAPIWNPPTQTYSKEPVTPAQVKFLQEKMKNLKKTKNSTAFLAPVDYVALNILTYPDIVKQPMDLTTMETKLRNGEYQSVQDFSDDFDLIIGNTRKFNGDAHAVTQAGMAMEAYFRKMMEAVPSADQPAPSKMPKRQSPAVQKAPSAPRRESRSVLATSNHATPVSHPVSAPAPASSEAFALQPDGTPQIRRDSNINRPARTIKPPAPRELPYSKPRRKEAQLELKFCDHVLGQIRGPRLATLNSVFQAPVDPVALNIPHYRQVIKHPMDLGTIAQKLKSGQYGKASEFKKDFDLMIQNCLLFNPSGNLVRDMGISLQREFDILWRNKDKWERARKADAQRVASASEDESEEEEDEEDDPNDQTGTIAALKKQLADMQSALEGFAKSVPKPKKTKSGAKSSIKKSSGSTGAVKSKSLTKPKVPKKPKQVTYEEKQEISEAVGKMTGAQVEKLTQIITSNCKKYADMEEMELEIDDLPNDVQTMLLSYVRGIFGNPNKRARAASPDDLAAVDDDDFEPDRGNRKGGKRKKHRPMGKKEQEDTITSIQRQLAQFQNLAPGGSESPTHSHSAHANQDADTSGDDESDESEEE